MRTVTEAKVDGHDVSGRVELVVVESLDADVGCSRGGEVPAPRHHPHAQRASDRRHQRADVAQTDESEHPAVQLEGELGVPGAAADRTVVLRYPAGQRENEA